MGWTAVTNNMDWSAASTVAEYFLACAERQAAVAVWPIGIPAVGDDVQSAGLWSGLQAAIEDLVPSFVDHAAAAGGLEGGTAIPMWTLSAWRTAAGIASGFRRATTIPADWTDYGDAAFSYGPMEAGDIIGPWVFADLQAAMHALRWTADSADGTEGHLGTNNGEENANHGSGYGATLAAAKTAAESDYDGGTHKFADSTSPRSYAASYHRDQGGGSFYAVLYRSFSYPITHKGSAAATDIDWYVQSRGSPSGTWNDEGDFPSGYSRGTMHKFLTDSGVTGTPAVASAAFGSLAKPVWGSADSTFYGYGTAYGFTFAESFAPFFWAVLKWDVAGGFEYR